MMIILGHENPDVDSIVSSIILDKILKKKGYNSKFIIPDKQINKDTFEILSKYNINPYIFIEELPKEKNQYILVDHNEREVDGEIICVIDHHVTNKKYDIKEYYNTCSSSTACFIAKYAEEILDKKDLELAVLATMIDTVSFHSTKGRKEDDEWCKYICKKYDLDYQKLYNEGLYLTNMTDIEEVKFNGLKKYNFNNKKVESSYIQIENPNQEKEKIEKIIEKLKQHIIDENLYAFVFIVHDMSNFKTMYYLIEKDNIQKKYYDRYEQRGNTIMPEVLEYVNNK